MWKTLTALPFTQLRKNRFFYLWYDGFYFVVMSALVGLMAAVKWPGLVTSWTSGLWVALPLACYAQILCSVFIHNCTHSNFPRPINRLVGELCGLVVLTRFASWEIIHQRHHRYSDDRQKDPHPVENSYWAFLVHTIINVEHQLQTIFFELYGDTPENRLFEKRRAWVSYCTNLVLVYAWYRFLGPVGFFALFVPAAIVGFLHLVHFNWVTHNASSPEQDFKPVNNDEGILWLGNRLFFGIYMHGNHHKRPDYFNPMHMKVATRTWALVTDPAAAAPASDPSVPALVSDSDAEPIPGE